MAETTKHPFIADACACGSISSLATTQWCSTTTTFRDAIRKCWKWRSQGRREDGENQAPWPFRFHVDEWTILQLAYLPGVPVHAATRSADHDDLDQGTGHPAEGDPPTAGLGHGTRPIIEDTPEDTLLEPRVCPHTHTVEEGVRHAPAPRRGGGMIARVPRPRETPSHKCAGTNP